MAIGTKSEKAIALQTLYQSSREARWILDHFASRQRNRKVTTADRLYYVLNREHDEISRRDVIECFRQLEEIGCGEFIVGRQGYPSRFEWAVSLISAGQAAIGEAEDVEAIGQDVLEAGEDDDSEEEHSGVGEHRFVLRRDFVVRIELRYDVTTMEASRLADFIKTLPLSS